jgi:hypothetical protein
MLTVLRAVLLLGLLGLSGCASLSRNECASGDWYGIGLRDGANGHTEARFVDHASACVEHGISADRERWLDGRERGLDNYCTARHAFDVGAGNGSYAGVCAGPAEEDFMHGYRLGKDLAAARDRRSHWDHEIRHLRKRLDDDRKRDKDGDKAPPKDDQPPRLTNAERVEIGYRLGVAVVRRDEADRDVTEIDRLGGQL